MMAPIWRYSGEVATIQVKHVPDDVHEVLQRRAKAAGQSLQEYLLGQLAEQARQPSLDEWLVDADQQASGQFGLGDAVAAVRADRDNH
ncbi:MAG: hypothetical protein JWN67_860 [Actinomycetia bacterium]|nr:hypothetical protein [Actinomycetes bacterium]